MGNPVCDPAIPNLDSRNTVCSYCGFWYSNHQNKILLVWGAGVIFGDFLKISTILFRGFFFQAAKIKKRKQKQQKKIQTKKKSPNPGFLGGGWLVGWVLYVRFFFCVFLTPRDFVYILVEDCRAYGSDDGRS